MLLIHDHTEWVSLSIGTTIWNWLNLCLSVESSLKWRRDVISSENSLDRLSLNQNIEIEWIDSIWVFWILKSKVEKRNVKERLFKHFWQNVVTKMKIQMSCCFECLNDEEFFFSYSNSKPLLCDYKLTTSLEIEFANFLTSAFTSHSLKLYVTKHFLSFFWSEPMTLLLFLKNHFFGYLN